MIQSLNNISIIIMNPTLEEKLETIFTENFQIKRVMKQIQNLRQGKSKMGYQIRYSLTRGQQISIIIQINKNKLKDLKSIAFLQKLEFRIVLKASYPNEPPRVYFYIQNPIQFGLNPFYDYFKSIAGQWSPKTTVMDIIKYVPLFLAKRLQKSTQVTGVPLANQFFEVERLFTYLNCQTFPVKLIRDNKTFGGMLVIVNQTEIVILEQTNFQNSYSTADFIPLSQVHSISKHKTKMTCCMLQIKRGGKKFGLQFHSDEYDTIISAISDAIKANLLFDKPSLEESSSSDDQAPTQPKKENTQLVVNNSNIEQIESQLMIMQSIVANSPNSKNVKEVVDTLKKLVEYYSIKGDKRCQLHLKNLQELMANEMMQILLVSQQDERPQRHEKNEYSSIANII